MTAPYNSFTTLRCRQSSRVRVAMSSSVAMSLNELAAADFFEEAKGE